MNGFFESKDENFPAFLYSHFFEYIGFQLRLEVNEIVSEELTKSLYVDVVSLLPLFL